MSVNIENSLVELQSTEKLCQTLLQSPHYKKIGAEGIYAIVEMAKSVGVDPLLALNSGMYFVRGKVEMSALLMNMLIRQAGHSITKSRDSDDTICVLHGKRVDNGDTWVESFSLEDAKRANLLNNPTWKMYPKDMLFARALSRLARQLFPDLIKGAYVEGEITMAAPLEAVVTPVEVIGHEKAALLSNQMEAFPEFKEQVQGYLDRQGIEMPEVTVEHGDKITARLLVLQEANNE